MIDVIECNFSNNLAELQVQKFEACHQEMTQENQFNKVSSFAHRVVLLSYAQGRTLCSIVEHHVVAFLLHEVGCFVYMQVRVSCSQG